jgi:hypothetical protein
LKRLVSQPRRPNRPATKSFLPHPPPFFSPSPFRHLFRRPVLRNRSGTERTKGLVLFRNAFRLKPTNLNMLYLKRYALMFRGTEQLKRYAPAELLRCRFNSFLGDAPFIEAFDDESLFFKSL